MTIRRDGSRSLGWGRGRWRAGDSDPATESTSNENSRARLLCRRRPFLEEGTDVGREPFQVGDELLGEARRD